MGTNTTARRALTTCAAGRRSASSRLRAAGTDPECALTAREHSKREVHADEEDVGASPSVAVDAVEEHQRVFIADVAAADEAQGGESIDTDVLGEQLRARPGEPGDA